MSSSLSSIARQTDMSDTVQVSGAPQPSGLNRRDQAHAAPAAHLLGFAGAQCSTFIRERFYPDQLRKLLTPELQRLTASRECGLDWVGWDRSLPRMYLPIEPLARLLIEAVDGISSQLSTRGGSLNAVRVRAQWQPSSHSHLTMSLESDQWQCDPRFRGALNARWFHTGGQAHLWQRLARLGDIVNGWLSVCNVPGGGTSLVLNVPIDNPASLVFSWLSRQAREQGANTRKQSLGLSLFVVGRQQRESIEQLRAANVRLQSLARNCDFVYRAAHGRWIVLTTEAELPGFIQTSSWQSQRLDLWCVTLEHAAIWDLARRVGQRFNDLTAGHIPAVDLRTHQVARGPVTPRRPNTRVDAAQSTSGTHLHSRMKQASKWRYPI